MSNQGSPETLDFNDIFDLWLPPWWESPWIVAAIILSVVGLMLAAWRFFVWYKRRRKQFTPLEIAVQRIVTLHKKIDLCMHNVGIRDEQSKEIYVEFTDTIKQYLDATYGLKTSSKTDYELLSYLDIQQKHLKAPELHEWRCSISTVMESSIGVKFGRATSDHVHIMQECEIVQKRLNKMTQKHKGT